MKTLIPISLLFIFSLSIQTAYSKSADSLVFKNEHYAVYQNKLNEKFAIYDKQNSLQFDKVKHVSLLYPNLQIITAQNELLYLTETLEQVAVLTPPFIGVCGTVPHYELQIEKSKTGFNILEDETFYDNLNEPAVIKASIDFSMADDAFFISKTKSFMFTANYGYNQMWAPDPRTVIYQKNALFYIWGDPTKTAYDAIEYKDGKLLVQKNGLVGIYGYTAAIFKSIDAFSYDLAMVTLPNGKKGFVNVKGFVFTK